MPVKIKVIRSKQQRVAVTIRRPEWQTFLVY